MSLYDLFEELQSSDGTVDIANLEKEVANEYDVSTYMILKIQIIFCGFFSFTNITNKVGNSG